MHAISDAQFFPRRSKGRIVLLSIASLSLLVSAVLRFIPRANDLISGPAEPMRRYAFMLAKSFAKSLNQSPVLVIKAEHPDCEPPRIAQRFKGDRLYLALQYSEVPSRLCLILYANAASDSDPGEIVTLTQASGKNVGRKISAPAQAVPVGYSHLQFPDDLRNALDWRIPENPLYDLTGKLQVDESFPDGVELSLKTVESQPILGFRDLVGEKHALINDILLWVIGLLGLTVSGLAIGLFTVRCSHLELATPATTKTGSPAAPESATVANTIHGRRAKTWHQRRRILLVLIAADILSMILLLLVRFTPRMTDALAGSPQYVRSLTQKFAQLTVNAEGPQAPVLLVEDENETCQPVRTASVIPRPDSIYYFLSYSEKMGLSCFTVYVTPANGVVPNGIIG